MFTYPLGKAIADGVLVPLRQVAVYTSTDLSRVASKRGEFVQTQLAQAVRNAARNRAVVEAYQKHAINRPTLVFGVDVAHVEELREAFTAAGVGAVAVTGQTKAEERRQALADFAAGKADVLVNCELLTEGYDERRVSCVLMARPTQSTILYQQAVGRGLRVDEGKRDCLVIDVLDRAADHRPVVAACLFGGYSEDCEGQDARVVADQDKWAAGDAPLRPTPRQLARWASGEDVLWLELPDLAGLSATNVPEPRATESQLRLIGRFGFEVLRLLTMREASYLIDLCWRLDGRYPTPATDGQLSLLRQYGVWEPGLSKRQAERRIGQVMSRYR